MELPDILHIEAVGYRGLAPCKPRSALPPSFIGFEAFCRVLQQMPGLRRLHMGGGDALLHPRFFDMVRAATQQGIEVSASSILTGLSRERAEACVESGLQRFVVAYDPSDAVLQRNLRRLREAKDRLGARTPEIEIARLRTGGQCDRPWRAVYLGTSGEVLACDRASGPRRPVFGSAAKQGVLKAWNADAFHEFRHRLASDTPPDVCASCEMRHSALGFGENAEPWNALGTPAKSVPSSTTVPSRTAA
jgi:radical SAM protein with 4Fe4S-binding SPASM domain